MHVLLLVTTNKEEGETSHQARERVSSTLLDDLSFLGEGGRLSSPVCDWFVIGGRWSGELTKRRLPRKQIKAFEKAFEEQHGWWLGGTQRITEDTRREQACSLFRTYVPDFTGEMPYWRAHYQGVGSEDDAQVIDKQLYTTVRGWAGHDKAYDREAEDLVYLDVEDRGLVQQLRQSGATDSASVEEIYLRCLGRPPTALERTAVLNERHAQAGASSEDGQRTVRREFFEDLLWAIVNSKEFLFNH